MLDLEAELALSEASEWPALVESVFDGWDLPGAIGVLALRWSVWRASGYDLFAGVRVTRDSLLWAVLQCPALRSIIGLDERSDARVMEPVAIRDGELILVRGQQSFAAGSPFMMFVESADRALRRAGVSVRLAALVASALVEMAANAIEHAVSPHNPLVVFQQSTGQWAFSVTDLGRGLRESLASRAQYAGMGDQEAMHLCLQDGVSRFATPGRGSGFTTLFQALAESFVHLSLRSGSVASDWTGISPTAQQLTFQILPPRAGFHLVAHCKQLVGAHTLAFFVSIVIDESDKRSTQSESRGPARPQTPRRRPCRRRR